VSAGDDASDEAGRSVLKGNPANDCEHRLAYGAVKPSDDDKSCRSGNRQRSERLVPDILSHATASAPRRRSGIG
jgi:hypothetical protein